MCVVYIKRYAVVVVAVCVTRLYVMHTPHTRIYKLLAIGVFTQKKQKLTKKKIVIMHP